jgi:uncharacterized protein DUF4124
MKLAASASALLFTLALTGSAAHAELFRCTGPDGKTIFTDQKHTCPGAEPSEPAGVVHRAETPQNAPAAPSRDLHAPDVESEAAQWKQKKRDAELQLEQLHTRREWLDRVADNCNRPGRYVVKRDDAGIKQMANCSELKRELVEVETQEAAARDYLASGLAEECRRAGCLPGWVR